MNPILFESHMNWYRRDVQVAVDARYEPSEPGFDSRSHNSYL